MLSYSDQFASLLKEPVVQFAILVLLRMLATPLTGDRVIGRLAANIVFFVALTALLLYHRIPPYAPDITAETVADRIGSGILKAIWWIGGAMLLASLVRTFLTLERKPREGRLLQDLVVGIVYLGAALSIIAYVFSLPVGTLIATSGVFAIVLGLALQSTLNDVFSGIALNLGKPLSVGDWIRLEDDTQGSVVETNWRSTELLSGTNDLIIVPNSVLAKSRIVNISSPDNTHGSTLKFKLAPTKPPSVILQTMERVLLSSNAIMKTPPPTANFTAMDANYLEIELSFRVSERGQLPRARNELYDLVFRHTEASGLQLASDGGAARVVLTQETPEMGVQRQTSRRRLLDAISLFSSLTSEEREELASAMNKLSFKEGDIAAHRDTSLTSLMILRNGVMTVEEIEDGQTIELERLAPGDVFGERGVLMGALEPGDIKAITAAVVYEIPKERLAAIMRERPAIAEELAMLLSARSKAEERLHMANHLSPLQHASSVSARIRHLFGLG